MTKGLEALTSMEYPGRFIVLGVNGSNSPTVVYGITGRSESSQARRLIINNEGNIELTPTNP